MNAFRLDDRVALVTGACGKLGTIWVRALLGAGARVAALDLPGVPPSPALGQLAETHSDRCRFYTADITDRRSLAGARTAIERQLGPVGVLVNNAGIDQPPSDLPASCRLEEISPETCGRILQVNLVGLFLTTQVFLPSLRLAGNGTIINLGSLYGEVSPDARYYEHIPVDPPFLKPPMYGASKAGVSALTRYLATHLAPDGIRVNALLPGGVLGDQDAEFRRKFCERVPLGRMATAEDLEGPLLFLASAASRYVTGQSLLVDGGYTAW